jgi:hypothetical protein
MKTLTSAQPLLLTLLALLARTQAQARQCSAALTNRASVRAGADAGTGLDIALRALAAIVGGYALTAAATSLLGVLLAALSIAPRADAAIIATMLSFLIYACAVLWAFAARSARLAYGALLTLTGMLALPLMLLTAPGTPWLPLQ